MTNHLVVQRLARVSMLGIDVEARLDITDEPVFEAGALGILLEYKESYACRQLVRRLINDGRLSWRSTHGVRTENSADNSMLVTNGDTKPPMVTKPVDVFVVEQHGQVGTVVRTTEQLWLTERACLLVATASDTERAWTVRTALVDFFLEARRQRLSGSQTMLDEARAIREDIAQSLQLDARLRRLEQSPRPRVAPPVTPTADLGIIVRRVLIDHPKGLSTSEILDIARADINAARGRKTLPVPLGREIAQLEGIERRWKHGHIALWALRVPVEITHAGHPSQSEPEAVV